MADKLRLGTDVRELKIGQSFTSNKSGAFHAVRYDFKPASVDINKIATVDIGNSNQVTVNVPHLDGAGVPATVFKGSHRPFTKECVLIIDRVTGEITLEKLSSNIQLKKTRSETARPPLLQADRGERSGANSNMSSSATTVGSASAGGGSVRPQTPPIGQRQSNKTRVTSGSRRPDRPITQLPSTLATVGAGAPARHSPLRASPNYASPRAPPPAPPANGEAASLPMIGIDDFAEEPLPPPPPPPPSEQAALPPGIQHSRPPATLPVVQLSSQSDSEGSQALEMSDSSSSSSSSDSESDRDDEGIVRDVANGHHPPPPPPPPPTAMVAGNGTPKLPSLPTMLLNDDLQLSESGSDFDDDD